MTCCPPQHHPGASLRPLTHPDDGATPEHGTIATAGNGSRQVDQPVPGRMPNPAPIMQKHARALACEGARLTSEAGVTGWKIAGCPADWRTGPVRGVRAGPCRSHACSGRLPLLARLTCAALFVPPDAVSCRLPQLASRCPAGERLPRAALPASERYPTTRHSCVQRPGTVASMLLGRARFKVFVSLFRIRLHFLKVFLKKSPFRSYLAVEACLN